MWFLLLIVSFTSAELVDPDDNIAMESRPQAQALHYRAKYAKPEYFYRPEEDNNDYDTDDYHSYTKSSLKHPKKYYPQDDKVNVYINKNNYANRAREPRDEGWRPMSLQNEEEEQIVKHYHYNTTPKPQKQSGYYGEVGSKKQKKYEDPYDDNYHTQRPKQHPKQPASNYNDDQYRQPDQSQQQGHIVQFPSTFLQQIEEETKSGKMLGFASLVEHFSAEDDEEDIKAALKEGSLDDIKKTVPKSGMVFKIFQDDAKKPMSIEDFSSNDIDAIEFKPSASTYYAKPSYYEPPKKQPTEKKKKMKKIPIPQVPQQDDYDDEDTHGEDMRQEEKRPEMMMMTMDRPLPKPMPVQQERPQPKPMPMHQERPQPKPMEERPRPKPQQMEDERPRPKPQQMEEERPHRPQPPQMEKERPHRPQQLQQEEERPHRPQHPQKLQERPKYPKKSKKNQDQDSKPSSGESSRYTPVLQDTRSYAQIEAASKQRYRPIQLALSDNDDYNYYHQSSNNYPVKSALRYQEGQESQQQYQTSEPEGYNNHKWQSSGSSTSETEIRTPGSHLESVVVHSNLLKAPESSKHYYDHFKSQNSNHRPEAFDHNKALKGSVSFNAGNIIGNHNHGSDLETTRAPIQFVSESEATPKYKLPNSGHKHLKQHVQKYAETLFKNMYKIKEEEEEEETPKKVTSHRHNYYNQAEQLPKPTALVSVKLPRFEAETPMMTEDEFQTKFGHLPVVTTPQSYYLTTISTPLSQVIELKPSKPQTQALTQYWTVPERDNFRQNIPSADDYHQQSKYKASKSQVSTSYGQPSSYSSSKLNELSGEASNNNYKNTRGQIERPSTNWKDGQIYLTKDYKGKLSDLYIKSSDKENFHLGSSNDRPSRPKPIVLNTDLVSHVNDYHYPKKSKYDISLLPTYRFQKRGDKDEDSSKDVALVSENDRKGKVRFPPLETGFKPMYHGGQSGKIESEKKSFKRQGVIITGSHNTNNNDNDNRQFSVSASYQIHRSSESENGEK